MGELSGKTVVVSGVGPGLGQDTARIVLREGGNVVAVARRLDRLQAICAELDPSGDRIAAVSCDITDAAACTSMVEEATARFGGVDGVIHVAALDTHFGMLDGADLAEWRQVYEVNVFGSMQLVQASLPALKVRGGSVVLIGTQSTDLPRVPQMAYASSKGALRTLGRQLAVELGPHKIRVNNVIATWMWGPNVQAYVSMTAKQRGVEEQVVYDEIAANMPLGIIPEDDDVAELSCFLMSDRAKAITGQTIWVNAGEHIV